MKEIPLTKGQVSIVDDSDFEWLNYWPWHAQKSKTKYKTKYYAVRTELVGYVDGKPIIKTIFMHRAIIEKKLLEEKRFEEYNQFRNNPRKFPVDHINGNTLRNTRDNLRSVSHIQNHQNRHHKKTSKYPGVWWNKKDKKWRTEIKYNGKRKYIGNFNSEEKAYEAYKKAYNKLVKEEKIDTQSTF